MVAATTPKSQGVGHRPDGAWRTSVRVLNPVSKSLLGCAPGLVSLTSKHFAFGLHRADIGTVSGDQEGYFGAVAANYLHCTMDAGLNLISSALQHERPIWISSRNDCGTIGCNSTRRNNVDRLSLVMPK
jgi:hypothetical protein